MAALYKSKEKDIVGPSWKVDGPNLKQQEHQHGYSLTLKDVGLIFTEFNAIFIILMFLSNTSIV